MGVILLSVIIHNVVAPKRDPLNFEVIIKLLTLMNISFCEQRITSAIFYIKTPLLLIFMKKMKCCGYSA